MRKSRASIRLSRWAKLSHPAPIHTRTPLFPVQPSQPVSRKNRQKKTSSGKYQLANSDSYILTEYGRKCLCDCCMYRLKLTSINHASHCIYNITVCFSPASEIVKAIVNTHIGIAPCRNIPQIDYLVRNGNYARQKARPQDGSRCLGFHPAR